MANALEVVCRLSCHKLVFSTQRPNILSERCRRTVPGVGIHFLSCFLGIACAAEHRLLGALIIIFCELILASDLSGCAGE